MNVWCAHVSTGYAIEFSSTSWTGPSSSPIPILVRLRVRTRPQRIMICLIARLIPQRNAPSCRPFWSMGVVARSPWRVDRLREVFVTALSRLCIAYATARSNTGASTERDRKTTRLWDWCACIAVAVDVRLDLSYTRTVYTSCRKPIGRTVDLRAWRCSLANHSRRSHI